MPVRCSAKMPLVREGPARAADARDPAYGNRHTARPAFWRIRLRGGEKAVLISSDDGAWMNNGPGVFGVIDRGHHTEEVDGSACI
jgi:hypothetical protein